MLPEVLLFRRLLFLFLERDLFEGLMLTISEVWDLRICAMLRRWSRVKSQYGVNVSTLTREPSGLNLGWICYIYTVGHSDNKRKKGSLALFSEKTDVSLLFHCNNTVFTAQILRNRYIRESGILENLHNIRPLRISNFEQCQTVIRQKAAQHRGDRAV